MDGPLSGNSENAPAATTIFSSESKLKETCVQHRNYDLKTNPFYEIYFISESLVVNNHFLVQCYLWLELKERSQPTKSFLLCETFI